MESDVTMADKLAANATVGKLISTRAVTNKIGISRRISPDRSIRISVSPLK